jgi:chromosome segregation protein
VYLSKLKIFGFKSFAQKAEVHFPGNGLTAVVGPNGCGKSNIVDAIRWVIGEQRASQLRMSKMQDIIFSGTEDRPAMNMAEVSLVINNDRGLLPSEFSEIQITRRAYRNGDSEYLINNQECRHKDIQNLFYDTGMGAASYSLMEQKMIDSILSDKAEDRRVLFEEAAGVSKYKQQRKETLRQLERVRIDMERLEDNLRHVRQSVRQHEKQVARAEEWKKVRDRLRSLELSMAVDKFTEESDHLAVFESSRKKIADEQTDLQTRLTLLETQLQEKRLSISGDEEEYRELEAKVSAENREIQEMNSQCALLRNQRHNLETNIRRFREEIAQSQEQIEDLTRQQLEGERFLAEVEATGDLSPEQERLEESCQVLRDRVEELKDNRRRLTQVERSAREEVNRLKTRWERVDAELGQLQIQIDSLLAEQSGFAKQSSDISQELIRLESDSREHQAAQALADEQLLVLHGRLEDARVLLRQSDTREREIERERMGLQSRHDALEHMRHAGAGLDAGAKWILDNRSQGVLGSIADRVRVLAHLPLVEYCLGGALQALVLESPDLVSGVLDALDGAKAGRVNLVLPHAGKGFVRPSVPVAEGVVGCARDFVEADSNLSPLLDYLLGRWILVDDFSAAMRLAGSTQDGDLWFVAPGGRAVHVSGLVRGGLGKGDGAGLLSRKAEEESIQERLHGIQTNLQNLRNEVQASQELVAEMEQQKSSLSSDRQDHLARYREADAMLRVAKAREQSMREQSARVERSIADLHARRTKAESERLSDSELATAESHLRQAEGDLGRVSGECDEMEMQLRNNEDDLRDIKARRQESVLQVANGRQGLKSISQQLGLHQKILDSRQAEIEKSEADAEKIASALEGVEEQIQMRNNRLGDVEAKRDVAKEKYDVLVGALEEWNDDIRKVNALLREKDGHLRDVDQRVLTLRANHDRIKERIFEAWEFDLDNTTEFSRLEYDEKDSPKEIRELKEQMKKIGPVNTTVMEDYEAEKKRLFEVEAQFDDLDRARSSLERTIDKLDKIARERFLDTFRQIQRNFQDVFSSLMIGGEGKLTLQEDVDPLEAEIEVNARPTGKKMRGVKALSGGERALTATSLLFALYMVKPSPYCILDEVDGPLDDANIGRFVGLLRRFSRQTQFIVVTHNKRTMAACDMLYGVTQEIKGISRIASVQLDEASSLVK